MSEPQCLKKRLSWSLFPEIMCIVPWINIAK